VEVIIKTQQYNVFNIHTLPQFAGIIKLIQICNSHCKANSFDITHLQITAVSRKWMNHMYLIQPLSNNKKVLIHGLTYNYMNTVGPKLRNVAHVEITVCLNVNKHHKKVCEKCMYKQLTCSC